MKEEVKSRNKYKARTKGGYWINGKRIRKDKCGPPDGEFCIHHMFDGPFSAKVYHDSASITSVLAVEVECGSVRSPDINFGLSPIEVGGCKGVGNGPLPVYLDAQTANQQKAMASLVRAALEEAGFPPAGAGYQAAEIGIYPSESANQTKIRVNTSTTTFAVDEVVQGTGKEHKSGTPCDPVFPNIPTTPNTPNTPNN